MEPYTTRLKNLIEHHDVEVSPDSPAHMAFLNDYFLTFTGSTVKLPPWCWCKSAETVHEQARIKHKSVGNAFRAILDNQRVLERVSGPLQAGDLILCEQLANGRMLPDPHLGVVGPDLGFHVRLPRGMVYGAGRGAAWRVRRPRGC